MDETEELIVKCPNIKTNGHSSPTIHEINGHNGVENGYKNGHAVNGNMMNLTKEHYSNGTSKKIANGKSKIIESNGVAESSKAINGNGVQTRALGEVVPGSQIQDFYKGKSVLVTGVTGFVGKVLLERLLVSCPGLETVYVIIREKKGHSASSRVDKLFQDPIYSLLGDKMKSKVYMMVGDIGLSMLGLSNEDYETLVDNVNIVMHCAANVRFDSSISELIKVNVKGTCDLLELSRKMKNLISFIYVSTIYAYHMKEEVFERVYEPGLDVDVALGLETIEPDDGETLQIINDKILQSWPNTYSFTKAIAENAVKKMGQGLPTCIFRPGLVTSTSYKHPIPGYLDNTNGTMSYLIAAAMGAINILPGYNNKNARTLPADYCANAIIACSWDSANKIYPEPKVYNYVPEDEYAWTFNQLLQTSIQHTRKEPYDAMYGYPIARFTDNFFVLRLVVLLLQVIPGLFGDIARRIVRKKPLYIKACRRLMRHSTLGFTFATESLKFRIHNSKVLHDKMCPVDKNLFQFNLDDYCFQKNIPVLMRGAKKYILKEKPGVSEKARKNLNGFKIYLIFSIFLYAVLALFLLYHLLRIYVI